MKTITLKTAMAIAADWHGGQWSALYAFASGGLLIPGQELLCLTEIESDLNSAAISRSQVKRLQTLKTYFENKRPKNIRK